MHSYKFSIISLFTFLVSSILFVNCSSQPKQVTLKYNLKEGEAYRLKTTTNQIVKQDIYGEKNEVKNSVIGVTTYTVKHKSDSITTLKVSYDSLFVTIALPSGTMNFNSSPNSNQLDLFSQVLQAMSGKSFEVRINSNSGKVIEILGLGKLFEDVINEFRNVSGEEISSISEILNKSYGERAFKDAFESTISMLPKKVVKIGDSWNYESKLSNVDGHLEHKWTLENIQKKSAKLLGESVLKMSERPKEVYVEGVVTKLQLTGTQKASFDIDYETGWTNSGKLNQNFSGTMMVTDTESGETAEWPIEMISEIIYQTVE